MKANPWHLLELSISPADADVVSGLLWGLKTQGIEEIYSKPERTRLRAFFQPESDIRQIAEEFQTLCRSSEIQLLSFSLKTQKEKDWLKNWREKLKPFPVGARFYVIPCLELDEPVPPGRIPIWLEPGMAFGTGTHETTQLCLETLETRNLKGANVLDIGTGSGILAIAAIKLGARRVAACDIDPEAVRVARSNSITNQCDREIEWFLGSIDKVGKNRFDLIVANLTAKVFDESLLQFEKHLKPKGIMVLSGVLIEQSPELLSLLADSSLRLVKLRKKGEWECLILESGE